MDKKRFIFIIAVIGILLNISTEIAKIYLDMPKVVSSNILGTILMAVSGGPLVAGFGASVSNLILANSGMGNSGMNIFFIVKMMEGLVAGIVIYKKKYGIMAALLASLVLSISIPLVGSLISSYKFGVHDASGFQYILSVLEVGFSRYTEMISSKFTYYIMNYGFSCFVAIPVSNYILKFSDGKTISYK